MVRRQGRPGVAGRRQASEDACKSARRDAPGRAAEAGRSAAQASPAPGFLRPGQTLAFRRPEQTRRAMAHRLVLRRQTRALRPVGRRRLEARQWGPSAGPADALPRLERRAALLRCGSESADAAASGGAPRVLEAAAPGPRREACARQPRLPQGRAGFRAAEQAFLSRQPAALRQPQQPWELPVPGPEFRAAEARRPL
jgi:hypothetical protein